MDINVDKLRNKLEKLNAKSKYDGDGGKDFWKPNNGNNLIRLVPNKFKSDQEHAEEGPFVELYFHYNINGKAYISPKSFGKPDPFEERAREFMEAGDKETSKLLWPRLRTFVPMVCRDDDNIEELGIRWWGFGITVYRELLTYLTDPDWSNMLDLKSGHDLVVKLIPPDESGKTFATTNLMPKKNQSPIYDDLDVVKQWFEDQVNITTIYDEKSYDELTTILDQFLDSRNKKKSSSGSSSSVTSASSSDVKKKFESKFDDLF